MTRKTTTPAAKPPRATKTPKPATPLNGKDSPLASLIPAAKPEPVVAGPSEPLTMSTREIAELTGKELKNVNRDARLMLKALGLDALSFERIYRDSMNRAQTEYALPKDLSTTLVSGYSIPMRHRIVKRWIELEDAARAQAIRLTQNELIEVLTRRAMPLADSTSKAVRADLADPDPPARATRSRSTPPRRD